MNPHIEAIRECILKAKSHLEELRKEMPDAEFYVGHNGALSQAFTYNEENRLNQELMLLVARRIVLGKLTDDEKKILGIST